ncbi:LysM peptidoglycan-binding domain-containing protein, partial [Staphylococcus capitis]|uniref:LysM peptidoglycan-binding domain-containing protein n=1 Tax=Staphylococcus capitis TaxID=29388 RepID=UPI00248188FB
ISNTQEQSQEQSQPQDSTDSKETSNTQEQSQPQDSTDSKETSNTQEQSQPQNSTDSKETSSALSNSNNAEDLEVDAQKASDKDVEADAQKASDKDVEADAQKASDKDVKANAQKASDKDVKANAQKASDKDVEADAQKTSDKDVEVDTQKASDKDVEADAQKTSDKDVEVDTQKASDKDVEADAQKTSDKDVEADTKKANKDNSGLNEMINQSKNDKNYKFDKNETLKQLDTSGIDKKVGNYIKDNWDDLSQKEILSILLKAYNDEEGKYETLATNNKRESVSNRSAHPNVMLMANKATTKTKNYTVKNGDYLGGIAEKFHTTVSNLQKLNKSITNPDSIYAGQVIKVPSNSSSTKPSTGKHDKPSKGDTSSKKQLVTKSQLAKFGWNKNGLKDSVVKDLNNALNKFKINTPKRIQHFMAQVAQESMKGLYPTEIANGDAYEGRTDLGNTQPGDGRKFKGGGYIQLTGRSNYTAFAKAMGDNKIIEKGVEYVANKYPWSSAAWFWSTKNINSIVDNGGTVTDVTRVVNGGTNGLNDRIAFYKQAKNIFK